MGLQMRPDAATTCTDSLQAKIDAAPPAGTVRADPCVYREQITITKPLTLHGQPGSEIRGSDLWTKWSFSGGYWRSARSLPTFPQTEVRCMPNTSRCLWPEQVFLDGKALTQVATEPHSGQFAVDAGRRVLLKDDPKGHLVEVTVRRHWVLGTAAADGVTIEGFVMKHAANEAQSGALMNRPSRLEAGGSDWTVQNNRLSDAHGAILSFRTGSRHEVLNNEIFRAGQIGIHVTSDGQIIQGNKVHHNNTEDFDFRWEAGGMKLVSVEGAVVNSNNVYNNKGNAIHFDIDCFNNTISNNRVHHNARKGIQYELSFGGKIFGNVLWENGWATPERTDGAGITLHNSSTTEVYNNTLAWNADGIAVFALDREGTTYDLVHDVYVHDNTILGENNANEAKNHVALGWFQGWATTLFDSVNNNRGANNRYWYSTPESSLERFRWRVPPPISRLSDFNLTLGEENGRYLTQSEKDAVVASKGIPASPQPH
jgi:parallel beta-helix repeat protein